jgi:hypothetical protein
VFCADDDQNLLNAGELHRLGYPDSLNFQINLAEKALASRFWLFTSRLLLPAFIYNSRFSFRHPATQTVFAFCAQSAQEFEWQ